VRPLEIWDLLTAAGPLHTCRPLPGFPRLLVDALEALRAGGARRACGEARHAPFEALAAAGGGLLDPGVRVALQDHFGPSLFFFPDPVFAAGPGGKALLRQWGRTGVVADVGQTTVKVIREDRSFLHARNWKALPHADRVPPELYPRQRVVLRSFVAAALREYAPPRPGAVVLALPCDFPGGVPGACSYAGLEGDADFVEEVLAQAGLADTPCVHLNDAALAALSARELFGSRLPPITLVMTLGFGVGAALLEGGERRGL
jgi:hypothetical protein